MPALVSRIITSKYITCNINTATTPTTDLEITSPANHGYVLKSLVFVPTAAGTITITSGATGTADQDKIMLKMTLVADVPVIISECFAHTNVGHCVKVNTSVDMGNELTLFLGIV